MKVTIEQTHANTFEVRKDNNLFCDIEFTGMDGVANQKKLDVLLALLASDTADEIEYLGFEDFSEY